MQHYNKERSTIAWAAEQATRASAERTGIGQWLSGLVLREGKVRCHGAGPFRTSVLQWRHTHQITLQHPLLTSSIKVQSYAVAHAGATEVLKCSSSHAWVALHSAAP